MTDTRSFVGETVVRLLATYEGGPRRPGKRRDVQFLEPVTYHDADRGLQATIPAGAVTDWTSAPWWAWSVIPAFDMAAEASALHDSLLKLREVLERGLLVKIDREKVDRLYREALRPLGVPQWRRNIHWLGVRYQAWATGDR